MTETREWTRGRHSGFALALAVLFQFRPAVWMQIIAWAQVARNARRTEAAE